MESTLWREERTVKTMVGAEEGYNEGQWKRFVSPFLFGERRNCCWWAPRELLLLILLSAPGPCHVFPLPFSFLLAASQQPSGDTFSSEAVMAASEEGLIGIFLGSAPFFPVSSPTGRSNRRWERPWGLRSLWELEIKVEREGWNQRLEFGDTYERIPCAFLGVQMF